MPVPSVAQPVRFDDAVAAALFLALHELLDELVRFQRVAQIQANLAREDWSGYSRQWFDHEVADLAVAARAAIAYAAEEAGAIQQARAWASAENQRRAIEAQRANDAEAARLAELAAQPAAA